MTEQMVGRTLDDFQVPRAHVRAVEENQVRIVKDIDGQRTAYIVDTVSRTMRQVLPTGLTEVPLLVVPHVFSMSGLMGVLQSHVTACRFGPCPWCWIGIPFE